MWIQQIISFLREVAFKKRLGSSSTDKNDYKRTMGESPEWIPKELDEAMKELAKIAGVIDTDKLEWCKTCKYYRVKKEYEDNLWMSPTMLVDDYLPCNMLNKTRDVWGKQFSIPSEQRSWFPKYCHKWKKKQNYQLPKNLKRVIEVLLGILLFGSLATHIILIYVFNYEGGVYRATFPQRYWSKQVELLDDAVNVAQYSAKAWSDSLQVAKRRAPVKYDEVYNLFKSKGMDNTQARELAKKLSSVLVDYWERAVQATEIKLRKKKVQLKKAKEMLRQVK